MKRLLQLILLSFMAALTLSAKDYPVPFKTSSGIYGYRKKQQDSKPFPKYSYAGIFKNGVAPVSFDNFNYGLINEYECLITDLCFKGKPELSDNQCTTVVTDKRGNGYVADLAGKPLTPTLNNIKFTNGCLVGRDTATWKTSMYRPDMTPIPDCEYANYDFSTYKVTLGDSTYTYHLVLAQEDPSNSGYFNTTNLKDASGRSYLPSGFYELRSLEAAARFYKQIDDKLFTDNGLSPSLRNLFFEASKGGKHGIYFIDGTEIIPVKAKNSDKAMKEFAKVFKKTLAPSFKNGELKDKAIKHIEELNRKEEESEAAFLAAWGIDPNAKLDHYNLVLAPVSVVSETVKTTAKAAKGKKTKKGKKATTTKTIYRFNSDLGGINPAGEQKFDELIDHSVYFFGRKEGEKKFHLYNYLGLQMTVDPYDEIERWGYDDDNVPRYIVRNGEEWGLIDMLGNEIISPQFSEVSSGGASSGAIVVKRDDKFYLVDCVTGKFVNGIAYDKLGSYTDSKGRRDASRLGYETYVDSKGKEIPSIGTLAYNEACETDMTPEEKVVAFANVIELCGPDDRETLGSAYNNMGYYYQQAGDIENAKTFYKKGSEYGNSLAANNLRIITSSGNSSGNSGGNGGGGGNFLSTLGQIANALGQMSGNTAMGGFFNGLSGNGMTTGGGYTGDTGSGDYSSGSSNSGGGAKDPSFYTNIYQRWERNAKSNYESLTLQGTRTTKNGKADSGTTNGFWRQHTAGLKRNLRNAQSEMRKIRQEARRAGVNIPQSQYETVTVNY